MCRPTLLLWPLFLVCVALRLSAEVLPQKPEVGRVRVKVVALAEYSTFSCQQTTVTIGDGIYQLPEKFEARWPLKVMLNVGERWIVTLSRHVTVGPNGKVTYWEIHGASRD